MSQVHYLLFKTKIRLITRSKSNNWPTLNETPRNLTFFLGSPTWILLCAPSSLKPLLLASFAFYFSSFFFIFTIGCNHFHFFWCPIVDIHLCQQPPTPTFLPSPPFMPTPYNLPSQLIAPSPTYNQPTHHTKCTLLLLCFLVLFCCVKEE